MKPSPCPAGSANLLAGKVANVGPALFAGERLTDGVRLPEGAPWHSRESAFLLLTGEPIVFDLGAPSTVSFVRLQADNDDELFAEFSADNVSWAGRQFLPPVKGDGLRTREVAFPPLTARYVRLRVGLTDDVVAISEVEAFCAATPSPAREAARGDLWYRRPDPRQGVGDATPFLVYGLLTAAALAFCVRRKGRGCLFGALERAWFTLDLRSLGAFRILLAAYLLYDLAGRASIFPLFFSTAGWIPPSEEIFGTTPWFPFGLLHQLTGDGAMAALFAVAGLAYLALGLGFFTPVAHALSTVCLILIHSKVWALNHGGHMALRLLVLWTLFLPLGAFYSLDARARGTPTNTVFRSRLILPLMLQLAAIYLFNALSKFSGDWTSGNFSLMVLKVSCITTPLGQWAASWLPLWLGRLSTWFSVWAEALAPFLLLFPFYVRQCRRSLFLMLAGMHAAFGLLMYVRDFSYTMICFLFLFLPYEDLRAWVRWRPRLPSWNLQRLAGAVGAANRLYRGLAVFVAVFAVASALRLVRGNFPLSHWFPQRGIPALDTLVTGTQTLQEWCMFGSCGTAAAAVKNEEIVTIAHVPGGPHYDPLCRALTGRECRVEHGLMPPFPKVTTEPWTNYARNLFARNPAYLKQLRAWLDRQGLKYTVYKMEQPIVDPVAGSPAPLFRLRVLVSE